jgi:apolipoprotein N-acyltransferase
MKAVVKKDNGLKEKSLLLILGMAGIGLLSSAFGERWIGLAGLLGLVPLLWLETNTRRSGFLTVFAFYLVFSRGILPGAAVFFRDGSLIRSFVLWVSSAFALTLSWGLLWNDSRKRKAFGILLAVLSSVLPPLGLIGWGNCLTAAGLFFPGAGWFGIFLMLALYIGAAVSRRLRAVLIVLVLMVTPFLTVPALAERIAIDDVTILGLNTSFGRMASGSGDFDAQFEREQAVFRHIREMERSGELKSADIVVLPETVIGRMNPSVRRRWERFFDPFVKQGTVFIAGAEIPSAGGMKYDNAMVLFEGEGKHEVALQRFPVPFSMYRPFSGTGANAYLSSFGEASVMKIMGKKLGVLVCYEQFLTWPFLTLLSQKPDVILASSNLWWCKDTSLPGIQRATVLLWAWLFGVAVVGSVNK